ncbi:MAG: hypothetical protein HYY18_19205 [Planctomycetes bacterium]|nr:hypothetical protein [Planctomycetota bacterium]
MPPLRRLLLTGFEPFGEVTVNPSWEAVRPLDGELWGDVLVRAVRLPVSYARGPARLREEIENFRPGAVAMFGVAQKRSAISLERFAANRCDAATADNDGTTRAGKIDESGPERRESTLPIARIEQALRRAGAPVADSEDAGGFLCNRVFWEALSTFRGPAGFVHVPPFEAVPRELLERAVRAAARAVAFEEVILAAGQIAPVPGDVPKNLASIERVARRARADGARLALFPELAATGLAFGSAAEARKVAEPADGPSFKRVAALAKELDLWIAYGFVESHRRALFNSASLVSPAGDRFLYRKRRLYGHDYNWASEGDGGGPFDTALGRIGIAICHDVVYSDIAAESAGVDLTLMPTNWIGEEGPAASLRGFRGPVFAADRTGEEDGIAFQGRGGMYNVADPPPPGREIALATWHRPAIARSSEL